MPMEWTTSKAVRDAAWRWFLAQEAEIKAVREATT